MTGRTARIGAAAIIAAALVAGLAGCGGDEGGAGGAVVVTLVGREATLEQVSAVARAVAP